MISLAQIWSLFPNPKASHYKKRQSFFGFCCSKCWKFWGKINSVKAQLCKIINRKLILHSWPSCSTPASSHPVFRCNIKRPPLIWKCTHHFLCYNRRWSVHWMNWRQHVLCVWARERSELWEHSPPAEDPQAGEGPVAAVVAAGGSGCRSQLGIGGWGGGGGGGQGPFYSIWLLLLRLLIHDGGTLCCSFHTLGWAWSSSARSILTASPLPYKFSAAAAHTGSAASASVHSRKQQHNTSSSSWSGRRWWWCRSRTGEFLFSKLTSFLLLMLHAWGSLSPPSAHSPPSTHSPANPGSLILSRERVRKDLHLSSAVLLLCRPVASSLFFLCSESLPLCSLCPLYFYLSFVALPLFFPMARLRLASSAPIGRQGEVSNWPPAGASGTVQLLKKGGGNELIFSSPGL